MILQSLWPPHRPVPLACCHVLSNMLATLAPAFFSLAAKSATEHGICSFNGSTESSPFDSEILAAKVASFTVEQSRLATEARRRVFHVGKVYMVYMLDKMVSAVESTL